MEPGPSSPARSRSGGGCGCVRSSPSARERPAPTVWLGSGGGRSDVAIEKLTELGVREVGALVCERTRGEFRLDRWARVASAAGRQSKRADVPALAGPTPFAEVVGRPGAIVLDHEAEDAVPFTARCRRAAADRPRGRHQRCRARARPCGRRAARPPRRRTRAAQRDCRDRGGCGRGVRCCGEMNATMLGGLT